MTLYEWRSSHNILVNPKSLARHYYLHSIMAFPNQESHHETSREETVSFGRQPDTSTSTSQVPSTADASGSTDQQYSVGESCVGGETSSPGRLSFGPETSRATPLTYQRPPTPPCEPVPGAFASQLRSIDELKQAYEDHLARGGELASAGRIREGTTSLPRRAL